MAYMVYQRYTAAIVDAYRGDPESDRLLEQATAHRRWLESLRIDEGIKSGLVELARAVEEAFALAKS